MSEVSQQALVPSVAETGEQPITYADLLLREDLHPSLRPHIERLAAEHADIEHTAEISPEHHQHHIEIALPMVAGIDEKSAGEQDFIGEVVELGEEALEALDLSDKSVTPALAMTKVISIMDEVEHTGVASRDKAQLLENVTTLLRIMANRKNNLEERKALREDIHFQKLGIRSHEMIKNSLDRTLHQRIVNALGLTIDPEEQAQIEKYFDDKKYTDTVACMSSFADNGLLTLSSAIRKGVLKETSATPGDYVSLDDFQKASDEIGHTLRGYAVKPDEDNYDLFYGRNSFFGVVMERGGEDIERSSSLPKAEVENRARNSMMFVVNQSKLDISSRTDNDRKEDIIQGDIPPEAIDYILVDGSNYHAAEEAFGKLPIKIIKVDSIGTELDGHWEHPYTVPDYKQAVEQITRNEGPVWCHISRLPLDTYPKSA